MFRSPQIAITLKKNRRFDPRLPRLGIAWLGFIAFGVDLVCFLAVATGASQDSSHEGDGDFAQLAILFADQITGFMIALLSTAHIERHDSDVKRFHLC